MRHHGAKPFHTKRLEREPRLQCPKAPRQVRSIITRPVVPARQAPLCALEILRRRSECVAVKCAIAHQDKASVVRNLGPFVKVKCNRIGALDTCQTRRNNRRHHAERCVRAVDMERNPFAGTDIGECCEIIDGARVDRSRRSYHHKGPQPFRAVLGNCLRKRRGIDLVVLVDRDFPQCV